MNKPSEKPKKIEITAMTSDVGIQFKELWDEWQAYYTQEVNKWQLQCQETYDNALKEIGKKEQEVKVLEDKLAKLKGDSQ